MRKRNFDVDSYVSELISFLHSRTTKLPQELPVFYPGYRPSGPFALPEQVEHPADVMTPKHIMTEILLANKPGLSKLSVYKETCRVTTSKPFQLFLLDSFWWLFLDHCASVDLTRLRRQRETGVMDAQQQAVKMTSGELTDENTRRNKMTKEELALKNFENDRTETVLRKSYSVKRKIRARLHATVDDGIRHAHSRVLPQHLFDASDTESVSTNASTHFAGGTFGRQVRRRNEGTFLRGGSGKGGGMCSKIAPDRSETPSVIFRDSEWRRSTLHLALAGAPAARNFEELRDALTGDIIEEYESYQREMLLKKQELSLEGENCDDTKNENSNVTKSSARSSPGFDNTNNNNDHSSRASNSSEQKQNDDFGIQTAIRRNESLKKSVLNSSTFEIQKFDQRNVSNNSSQAQLGEITTVNSVSLPPIDDKFKKENLKNSSSSSVPTKEISFESSQDHDEHHPSNDASNFHPGRRRSTLQPQHASANALLLSSSPSSFSNISKKQQQQHSIGKPPVTVKQSNNLASQMLMPSESRAFYALREDRSFVAPTTNDATDGGGGGGFGEIDDEMRALLEEGARDEENNNDENYGTNNANGNSAQDVSASATFENKHSSLNDVVDSDEEDVQNNEHFYRQQHQQQHSHQARKQSQTQNDLTHGLLRIGTANTAISEKANNDDHHQQQQSTSAKRNNNRENDDDDDNDDADRMSDTDSVLSAASSIRTVDDVLRVANFQSSDARQDLYGLPADVRRSIVAREQHVLFSRMADRYVEAMNVQSIPFSRQQDRLIRVLPDIVAQFMFTVFYRILPCFRETVVTREFQNAIFKSISYWVGGVERECLNPYSWKCHSILNDNLYQHNISHSNKYQLAKKKLRLQQQKQEQQEKEKKEKEAANLINKSSPTSPLQLGNSSRRGTRRNTELSCVDQKISNLHPQQLTSFSHHASVRSSSVSSESAFLMHENSASNNINQHDEDSKEASLTSQEGIPVHSSSFSRKSSVTSSASPGRNNNNNINDRTSIIVVNSTTTDNQNDALFIPVPPALSRKTSTVNHDNSVLKSPLRSSLSGRGFQSSRSNRSNNNNNNNNNNNLNLLSSSGSNRKPSVSFGEVLKEQQIAKDAAAFNVEIKKAFFQRKQFKVGGGGMGTGGGSGGGMIETLLLSASNRHSDGSRSSGAGGGAIILPDVWEAEQKNIQQNMLLFSNIPGTSSSQNQNLNNNNNANNSSSSSKTGIVLTTEESLKERSQNIRAGAGLQRKKNTKDVSITIDEREQRAGTKESIFYNLDGQYNHANKDSPNKENGEDGAHSGFASGESALELQEKRKQTLFAELANAKGNKLLQQQQEQQQHEQRRHSTSAIGAAMMAKDNANNVSGGANSSPSGDPNKNSQSTQESNGIGFLLGTTNSSTLRAHTTALNYGNSASRNLNGVFLPKHIQEIKNKLDAKVKNVPWYGRANQRVPNNQDGTSGGVTSANFLALELSPLFQRFAASRLSVSDETASTLKQQVGVRDEKKNTKQHKNGNDAENENGEHSPSKYHGKARFSSYPVRPPSELHGTVRTMKWTIISPTKPVR